VVAHVHSAGLLEDGNPAHAHGVDVLFEQGIDVSTHRSRTMTADLLRHADLILGMERQHVREAVVTAPDLFPRTFTLKELVRRGGRADPRRPGPRRPGESVEAWLRKVHEGRTTGELLGESDEDDVEDPIGQPRSAYVRMVAELDDLLEELVWLLWGTAGDSRGEQTERAS